MDPNTLPLRDLQLPEPIGWWPLAPGWWLIIVLLALACVWLAVRAARSYRAGAARRRALAELKRLERAYASHGDTRQLAVDVSALLRRAMLAYAPRKDVAGLTGTAWLQWLDTGLGNPAFTEGAGRRLIELPYRAAGTAADRDDVEGMLKAVRVRLTTPVTRETSLS